MSDAEQSDEPTREWCFTDDGVPYVRLSWKPKLLVQLNERDDGSEA